MCAEDDERETDESDVEAADEPLPPPRRTRPLTEEEREFLRRYAEERPPHY